MPENRLKVQIGNTDVYLLDQFLKGRVKPGGLVLDAGCGSGRNLYLLVKNKLPFVAIDPDQQRIKKLQNQYAELADAFLVSSIENFKCKEKFDFIICNAVLHFATCHEHFQEMFSVLTSLLARDGILFIRMASDIGIENLVEEVGQGVYKIPDGSKRYLLTRNIIRKTLKQQQLNFLEPLKTVNVNDQRCMSTLVLTRNTMR